MDKKQRFCRVDKKIFFLFLVVLTLGTFLTPANASSLEWKENNSGRSYNYRAATCNEQGLYVVVGDAGMIKTSDDLINWNARDSGTKEYLFGCTYGSGVFVAAGNGGTLLYSPDGIKWSNAEADKSISFDDVTWGNGRFVVVGHKTESKNGMDVQRCILSSTDGIKWTTVFENKGEFNWSHIKYTNSMFVIQGLWDNIAFSSDSIHWTVKSFDKVKLQDIIWDGSRYVGVGDNSGVYTSTNLSDWTQVKTNLKGEFLLWRIVKFGNKYIAELSDNGSNFLLASTDLSNWNLASDRQFSDIGSFITEKDKLIAFGWFETVLQTRDAVNWDISEKHTPSLVKAVWNGSTYLAIGTDGTVLISPDGLDWKSYKTSIDKVMVDVIWTGKNYTAVGITYGTGEEQYDIVETTVYQSSDGINWVSKGILKQKNVERIFYLNDRYFLLGREGEIMTSDDATNWTSEVSGTKNWLRGIAWNGKQYICVGMFGTILSSPDGKSWSAQAAHTSNDLNSVIWNGSQFFSVGGWKTVAHSYDGKSWTARAEKDSTSFEDVLWNGKEFFALTDTGETYSSPNAKKWTKGQKATDAFSRDVEWNGYRYVIVSSNGTIITAVPLDFVKVLVDSKPIVFDVAPVNKEGRSLVPLRAIFNALGAEVQWDGATRTITGKKESTTIVLQLDSKKAIVNGAAKELDVPAMSYNGRTMVPARFISESLGADVSWDGVTQTMTITTGG